MSLIPRTWQCGTDATGNCRLHTPAHCPSTSARCLNRQQVLLTNDYAANLSQGTQQLAKVSIPPEIHGAGRAVRRCVL
jgi:hypothetical protein